MKRNISIQKGFGIAVLFMMTIGLASWQGNSTTDSLLTTADTLPKNKNPKDFEDVLQELEKSKAEIERSLKDIDLSALEKDLKKPIPPIPPIPPIEPEKIKAEVEKAMKEMKEIDAARMEAEVRGSLAKIDWEKINKDLEEVRKIDMSKIEADLKKIKPQIEASINKAKEDIEKAKKEIEAYRSFTDALEKEGLINKKENYKIEHKEGKLIINGNVQPADVYARYRSFLEKHPRITIKKDDNGLNISKD